MNRTLNQLINQLHLDPKKEAAVRKLFNLIGEGGSQSTNVMTIDINENTIITVDDFHKIKSHADNNGLFVINLNGAPEDKNHTGYSKFKFAAYACDIPEVYDYDGMSMIAINYTFRDERIAVPLNPTNIVTISFVIGCIDNMVDWYLA